jgi:hypothetical protein
MPMQAIFEFFNQPFFTVLGGLTSLLMLAAMIYTIYLILRGVIPVWIRLGKGLSKRKIAVFANGEFDSLKSMLVDSGIFKESNVVKIDKNSLEKAEDMTLFLVHWKSFESEIENILELKKDYAALVIYAPQIEGLIDKAALEKINQKRNAIIVNFRGRLLNDILTSMITTGYETK